MEKEKKKLLKKTILIPIILVIILIIGILVVVKLANTSLTNKDVLQVLEQDGRTEYLQKDTIKIGATIDCSYNQYNKIACYSCLYMGDITLTNGGLILFNKDTKEYKNIVTDIYMSSLISYLISENNVSNQREMLKLINNYFNENGIDNFSYGNKDKFDSYVELGKSIGKAIGIKQCREVIDKGIHDINNELDNFTFFYKKEEIFPHYIGSETTDKKFMWHGISESIINLLDKSAYNAMVSLHGQPYKYVTKYTILDWNNEQKVIGKYDSKEEAKEKFDLEDATDEPNEVNIPENTTKENNSIQTNTTNRNEENNTNIESNIKNGTYDKILTSKEKEDMLIELGDISIKIEGNKIVLTDIDMQCTLTGTYKIEEGKLIGKYTTAEYYSHEEMKDVTQTVEDRFEFEIKENNKLYDTMGYGQFLGKCLYRNATYELAQ